MIYRVFKGCMFFVLMLMVSFNLTGCSDFDLDAVIGGVMNVVGNLSEGIGGLIENGLGFVGDFIGNAMEVVGPLVEAGEAIFDNLNISERIDGALGTVGSVLDRFSDIGEAVTDVGRFIEGGVDAVGEAINENAGVTGFLNDPDNEDAGDPTVTTITQDDGTITIGDLVPQEEIDRATQEVVEGANAISETINRLTSELENASLTREERNEITENIRDLRNNLRDIVRNPTSSASRELLRDSERSARELVERATGYANIARDTVDAVREVGNSLQDAYDNVRGALGSIFG